MKLTTVILFLLFFYGCDIFTTREAEKPEQPRSNFELATTPNIVINNFVNSLKDKNTQNYLACLTDSSFSGVSFNFFPSAASVSKYPSLNENFGRKQEEQYLTNVLNKIPTEQVISLVLSDASLNQLGDSVVYSAKYFLSVPHNDISAPKTFQGELRFKIIRDSRTIWAISSWQDIKNSNLPSWSDLKGIFY
ncbi:MAG: hypothetical protein C0425_08920 [Chlorobiaceae bacterium]|nr:hypothetical protein [Chlorobiaceae bacterium]MBA4310444.1 hypothetical protein [Chlorobiaceae bacterium]